MFVRSLESNVRVGGLFSAPLMFCFLDVRFIDDKTTIALFL